MQTTQKTHKTESPQVDTSSCLRVALSLGNPRSRPLSPCLPPRLSITHWESLARKLHGSGRYVKNSAYLSATQFTFTLTILARSHCPIIRFFTINPST